MTVPPAPLSYTDSLVSSLTGIRLGVQVDVLIESPRWSLIKRRADGGVDFISPLPCPYNYGCVPGMCAGDGDPLDVVLLGPRRPRHHRQRARVVAVIGFIDEGLADPKLICHHRSLRRRDRASILLFFKAYSSFKRALNRLRGRHTETRSLGFIDPESINAPSSS